jgi:hypothetical protein
MTRSPAPPPLAAVYDGVIPCRWVLRRECLHVWFRHLLGSGVHAGPAHRCDPRCVFPG